MHARCTETRVPPHAKRPSPRQPYTVYEVEPRNYAWPRILRSQRLSNAPYQLGWLIRPLWPPQIWQVARTGTHPSISSDEPNLYRRLTLSSMDKHIIDNTVMHSHPKQPKPADPAKNPHAVALGRLGGLKGGAARAEALSPRKRSQIAAKAAKARWGKK